MGKESESDVNKLLANNKPVEKKDDFSQVCNLRDPLDLTPDKPVEKPKPGDVNDPSTWSLV